MKEIKIIRIIKKLSKHLKGFLKSNIYFSQDGEDVIINNCFQDKKIGFYVDIGAFDPALFSNTKLLYDRGWSGINVEPDVRGFNKFLRKRKRDINLNYAIGAKSEEKTFHMFKERALNTFSPELALERENAGRSVIKKTIK